MSRSCPAAAKGERRSKGAAPRRLPRAALGCECLRVPASACECLRHTECMGEEMSKGNPRGLGSGSRPAQSTVVAHCHVCICLMFANMYPCHETAYHVSVGPIGSRWKWPREDLENGMCPLLWSGDVDPCQKGVLLLCGCVRAGARGGLGEAHSVGRTYFPTHSML